MSELQKIVDDLENKYKSHVFMSYKLETHIKNLPLLMNNIEEQYCKRDKLKKELIINKNIFTDKFLSENLYYYIPQTEVFVYYDNFDYTIIKEDDIQHLIINTINNSEDKLQQWKFKIKTNIIKTIKETNLITTIPESNTIQKIINHFNNTIINDKNHIKYFLTVIGDCILNKKDPMIFLIDRNYKNLIQLLSQQIYIVFNKTITDCFKFKYSDHKYEYCRIIDINNINFDETFIKNNTLNIIVVSCHYSQRFGSSDAFLNTCPHNNFSKNVLMLKNNNQKDIVNLFLYEFTIASENESINFKDFYLLWKHFLKKYSLPHIISIPLIKSILTELNIYDVENDSCCKITNKFHSNWIEFKNFWSETISVSDYDDHNYEISELTLIFNDWALSKNLSVSITEEDFKEIYLWYNHDAVIEDNKYIHNIFCNLWDKTAGIDLSMLAFDKNASKNKLKMYKHYCDFITKNYDNKYIVSKSYFDKYICKESI